MINEKRRQEILNRLRKERAERKKLIQDGELALYQDDSLIQTPEIGHDSFVSQESSVLQTQREKLQEMKRQLMSKPYSVDHLKRLAEPKTAVIAEREELKQKIEEQKIQEMPFQPQISDQSQLLAQLKYSKYEGIPIYDRLTLLEQERQEHIEELKLVMNQDQETPESRIPKPYNEQPPIYERYQQVMQERKANLEYLKAKQLKDEEDLFKPKISAQSHLIAEIKNDGKDVVERLIDDARRKQEMVYSEHEYYDFQPKTNKEMNNDLVKGDFNQRQMEFTKKQMENNQMVEQEVFGEYTFQPQISKNSKRMRQNSQEQVFDKLYKQYELKQSILLEKQESIENKLNFYPELNAKSMEMAVDRKLIDLIRNEYGENRKQMLKMKYEEGDKECSFYPSVSTTQRYSQMHSQYSFDDCAEKIKQYQTEKEVKRSEAQQAFEQQKLAECTFKPNINKKCVVNTKAEVNGMETFMLKVDMARKQKDNQKIVEKKLFEMHNQYDKSKHQDSTKPKCFQLSENKTKCTYKKSI